MEAGFLRKGTLLTFVGSKTLDTNLGMLITKWGLDIATDRYAKTNNIKITKNDKHQQFNTKKMYSSRALQLPTFPNVAELLDDDQFIHNA